MRRGVGTRRNEESEDYMMWWADTDEQAAHDKAVSGMIEDMW